MAPRDLLIDDRPYQRLVRAVPGISSGAATDLALLLGGTRDLIRLSCETADAAGVIKSCAELGLATKRWSGSLRPAAIASGATRFVLSGTPSTGDLPDSRTFVFVARATAPLGEAEAAVFDDRAAGELFGYPPCCIDAYRRHTDHHLTHLEPWFGANGGGPWPYWCNTPVDAFGWHLVSHFPCSPECEATRSQALANRSALVRFDAFHSLNLLVNLRTIVISHPECGLAYGVMHEGRFHTLGSSGSITPADFVGAGLPDRAIRCDFTGGSHDT